ncbi:MAG: squalene/phytoene synthase family protein [Gaiellaceae bacterium]
MTPATAAAYEHCRRVARASGSSFYAGMRLLPADRRAALLAVYALARIVDDIADGPLPREEKLEQLARVRHELGHIEESTDPIFVAVADAARRRPVPLDAFDELVDGAELDVRGATFETFADLERYCGLVAGSIGRLALGVFDTTDRSTAEGLAQELGVALQLTNIVRDVRADEADGRVYLPAEDLDRFGCAVVDGRIEGPLELVLAFEAQRALERFERGLTLVPLLDRRSAACVVAMAGSYRHLLRRIAHRPELPIRGRVSLRPWEKGIVLARSLVGAA